MRYGSVLKDITVTERQIYLRRKGVKEALFNICGPVIQLKVTISGDLSNSS